MTALVKLIHHPDGVVECVLNRPDKMNALSNDLIDEIIRVGESLVVDSHIRAVIVRGEGRALLSLCPHHPAEQQGQQQAGGESCGA